MILQRSHLPKNRLPEMRLPKMSLTITFLMCIIFQLKGYATSTGTPEVPENLVSEANAIQESSHFGAVESESVQNNNRTTIGDFGEDDLDKYEMDESLNFVYFYFPTGSYELRALSTQTLAELSWLPYWQADCLSKLLDLSSRLRQVLGVPDSNCECSLQQKLGITNSTIFGAKQSRQMTFHYPNRQVTNVPLTSKFRDLHWIGEWQASWVNLVISADRLYSRHDPKNSPQQIQDQFSAAITEINVALNIISTAEELCDAMGSHMAEAHLFPEDALGWLCCSEDCITDVEEDSQAEAKPNNSASDDPIPVANGDAVSKDAA
eukprot:Lankesteria_metandrocarpae@DN6203_c0_g1_i1.p1